MAADLFSAVKNQFKFDEVDSDNWVFKLFYRASFSICLASSILCVATTYIGNPITCDHPHTTISMDLIHQVRRAATEKSTVVGHWKGSGIGDNLAPVEWVYWWVVCSAVQANARGVSECVVVVVRVSLCSKLSSPAVDLEEKYP